MADIQVNFNALRRHAIDDFDAVVRLLKRNISFLDETGPDFREELASRLDELRSDLATIALCRDEENGIEDVLGDRELLTLSDEGEDEDEGGRVSAPEEDKVSLMDSLSLVRAVLNEATDGELAKMEVPE
jgi:hypothetical protein